MEDKNITGFREKKEGFERTHRKLQIQGFGFVKRLEFVKGFGSVN